MTDTSAPAPAAPPRGGAPTAAPARPFLRRRDEVAFVVFSAWTITGLFLDGWAHRQGKPESFFTPWHAMLYSGFLAGMLWQVVEGIRARRSGEPAPARDPYAALGGLLFLAAGVGDFAWHGIFGIEEDLEALLSPTHLMLMAAGLVLTTAPLRAGWRSTNDRRPTLGDAGAQVVALAMSAALVSFFLMFANPFVAFDPDADPSPELAAAGLLLTNLLLVGPLAWLAGRTKVPAGATTLHLVTVVALVLGLDGFDHWPFLAAALAGGAAGEVTRRHAGPGRFRGTAAWVGAVSAATWTTHHVVEAVTRGVDVAAELWTGPVALAVLSAVAVAGLARPADAAPTAG